VTGNLLPKNGGSVYGWVLITISRLVDTAGAKPASEHTAFVVWNDWIVMLCEPVRNVTGWNGGVVTTGMMEPLPVGRVACTAVVQK
jgi:hypothetical protein